MHAFNAPYFHFCQTPNSKLNQSALVATVNRLNHDPNHAHSLMNLHWSAFLANKHLFRAQITFTARNEVPARWKQHFLSPFVWPRQVLDYLVPSMSFLQPSTTATMCTSPCEWPCAPLSVPLFLLRQNLHASVQRLSFLLTAQYDVNKSWHQKLEG